MLCACLHVHPLSTISHCRTFHICAMHCCLVLQRSLSFRCHATPRWCTFIQLLNGHVCLSHHTSRHSSLISTSVLTLVRPSSPPAMSTDTLLHDLYTLFFSYTQSTIYRTTLTSLTTSLRTLLPSLPTNKPTTSTANTVFIESRLQREYGYYSLSASHANSLSHNALVTLSFVLFVLFLIGIPLLSLICILLLSFTSSVLVYLTALSTAYVTISTVVYSLVLLQSLSAGNSGGAQFPLALSSLVYLYFLNICSFTTVYFTMVQTYDGRKGGTVLEGVNGMDGIVNLVHCFYFSISTFTTVGFGDIHGHYHTTQHTTHTPTQLLWPTGVLMARLYCCGV